MQSAPSETAHKRMESSSPAPTPKTETSSKLENYTQRQFSGLAQERRGTRCLEGSPELLLGRTRETVREGELDVRFLLTSTKEDKNKRHKTSLKRVLGRGKHQEPVQKRKPTVACIHF